MTCSDAVTDEVVSSLLQRPRVLSPKFFYDALGSKLFETITYLPEYYPTKCEMQVLRSYGEEIATELGAGVVLIELGSGQSTKVPVLLDRLKDVRAYIPVDIDADTLDEAATRLRQQFPELRVLPVAVDYTQPWTWPDLPDHERAVVFYPGSTIGNLGPEEAEGFLAEVGRRLRPGDGLLIGYDLEKDPAVLEAAYDDAVGVTAAFNKNMLAHLNRSVGTDFDVSLWEHRARWNAKEHRIEMHLVCKKAHDVHLGEHTFAFDEGETIHTESSYKYTRERFVRLAQAAGFEEQRFWTDDRAWFGVSFMVRGT